MIPPTAKALRCESCGAALSPDNPTCDYCGSHHDLPTYAEAKLTQPPKRPRSRRILITLAFIVGLIVVAVACATSLID